MTIKSQLVEIIKQAESAKASDIHFVNEGEEILMQFRIGALMLPQRYLTMDEYQQLLAYIKFHAALNLTHPKQPQSGLLTLEDEGGGVYARVSILPTQKFQSLVLRIINSGSQRTLDEIPLFKQNADVLKEMVNNRAGLVLISGPTGSGKTTTTYGFIHYLKQSLGKSIITIEDPVEYQQPDIVQMQVNESLGMTYDIGIKEILRHDPDVIIIGEIRDPLTARQALRAALTGHLVISTVHAKNVIGTFHRLLDLGISLPDLEQAIIGVANQRLVEAENDYKALFEFCFGETLDAVVAGLAHGK